MTGPHIGGEELGRVFRSENFKDDLSAEDFSLCQSRFETLPRPYHFLLWA